jgi:hypothetical protein
MMLFSSICILVMAIRKAKVRILEMDETQGWLGI